VAGTFLHVNVELNARWSAVEDLSQCGDLLAGKYIAVPTPGVQGSQLFQREVGCVACASSGPIDVRVMDYDGLSVGTEPEIEFDHLATNLDCLTKGHQRVFGMSPGGTTMGANLDSLQRRVRW
jgi:hypothetical protein